MDQAQSSDGLLAAVGKTTNQSKKSDGTWRSCPFSSSVWYYQERPMA